jgi:hypothetical protein
LKCGSPQNLVGGITDFHFRRIESIAVAIDAFVRAESCRSPNRKPTLRADIDPTLLLREDGTRNDSESDSKNQGVQPTPVALTRARFSQSRNADSKHDAPRW